MMTSSNGNIFRVTGPLCGEFTGPGEFPTQRPVTRSFDVFLDLRLNKRLSKQPWGWWFETPVWSLWRHCNVSGLNVTTCWVHRVLTRWVGMYANTIWDIFIRPRWIGFLHNLAWCFLAPEVPLFSGLQEAVGQIIAKNSVPQVLSGKAHEGIQGTHACCCSLKSHHHEGGSLPDPRRGWRCHWS